jgi:hypothetical protein
MAYRPTDYLTMKSFKVTGTVTKCTMQVPGGIRFIVFLARQHITMILLVPRS